MVYSVKMMSRNFHFGIFFGAMRARALLDLNQMGPLF